MQLKGGKLAGRIPNERGGGCMHNSKGATQHERSCRFPADTAPRRRALMFVFIRGETSGGRWNLEISEFRGCGHQTCLPTCQVPPGPAARLACRHVTSPTCRRRLLRHAPPRARRGLRPRARACSLTISAQPRAHFPRVFVFFFFFLCVVQLVRTSARTSMTMTRALLQSGHGCDSTSFQVQCGRLPQHAPAAPHG